MEKELKQLRKDLSGALARKITSRNSVWSHAKRKGVFIGVYVKHSSDRSFTLNTLLKNGKLKVISFESHEAAKKAGWIKV